MQTAVRIETRVHLLSTLAEAAELEHNLLCMYLYSVFGLKTSIDEGLTADEVCAVNSWRKTILEVCVQEMTHLALVTNLTTALGGGAHFFRPEFPVRPGYFPSEFVLELAPLDRETLQHFIFLERPDDEPVPDAKEFTPENEYTRGSPRGRLMAHGGDYSTVGQLYRAIGDGIIALSTTLGEKNLFCGSPSVQLCPTDVQVSGLAIVRDKNSALEALRLIVEQGEGARTKQGSHFEKFCEIAQQYDELRRDNPAFEPSRPAARNPVMRRPATPTGRVLVTQALAVRYLDLANALYSLMLRFLVQLYSLEQRDRAARLVILEAAFSLMHAFALPARVLTTLPANNDFPRTTAGISFTLDRYFMPFEPTSERLLLLERLDEILDDVRNLLDYGSDQHGTAGERFGEELGELQNQLTKLRETLIETLA